MFITVLLATAFFACPIYPIKFAILWFTAFIWIFLNWITIQQFIAERYAFIPSLGVCIIVAFLTQNTPLYWFILGIAIMRTWAHLPTYDNELRFYQSNVWNFPESEVAYGNLGVTQLRLGQVGTGMDSWMTATNINKEYDVPNYNLSSRYKATGLQLFEMNKFQEGIENLKIASTYLEKAINCKICHFRKPWQQELDAIKSWIADPMTLIMQEYKNLMIRDKKLIKELKTIKNPKRYGEVDKAVSDNRQKLQHFGGFIDTDIKSIEKQISELDTKLTMPIQEPEKKTFESQKKLLSDRLKQLKGVLYGK